ncbi:MAG: ABC transporter ATP-binding protein [Candidatus Rokubacteria bacterium]|nr:ABC transporter ATP-binding protein [Candidatus Rokubacteria bacterium]
MPVRLERVAKRFGPITALEDVTLTVPPGSLVTLLGPSGCGKTTTLRIVAGLEQPTSGRLFIGERDVTGLPPSARNVTMMFQSYALFPHLSVFENVAYGLRVQRRPAPEVRQRAEAALELVGLPGFGSRQPGQLSGGQQQRVALARAIVMEPEVLLFDEPLSNLDAKLRKRVRGELRQLQRRLGITSLYVTHDQAEALAMSDTVVVMNQGRVEQVGTPVELYRRPATRFVADFVGEANLLPATYDGQRVRLGRYAFAFTQDDVIAGPVTLMARPEAVRLRKDGGGLPGRVVTAFYVGAGADYGVETEVGLVTAVDPDPRGELVPEGSAVGLVFLEHGLYLLPPS